ncbi:MAG: TatD family hydrolase [Burkholderiales bacterium]|nr:TatD family hydrolase [Burkholderiales bacterium]
MLIDSHCHLNFSELYDNLDECLSQMQQSGVDYALCVGTRPDNLERIVQLANDHSNLFASVGIHPDERLDNFVLTQEFLLKYTTNAKVIAIGETGLDYFRIKDEDMTWQRERFILHIETAKEVDLPLIIHTRESIVDTLAIMREYDAMKPGAVMHCFTENLENAKKCLDLGFYISISGIVTFKNALIVQEVAKYIPLDMLLIETDAPFLAPAPFRGKTNHPALIKHTAQYIADIKGIGIETLAHATSDNFFNLFKKARQY